MRNINYSIFFIVVLIFILFNIENIQSCHVSCLTCTGESKYNCTSCNGTQGLILFNNNQCLPNCPNGYFINSTNLTNPICSPCIENCLVCVND
jgi:proprotein convertase subtilisin/kexin type 5